MGRTLGLGNWGPEQVGLGNIPPCSPPQEFNVWALWGPTQLAQQPV